MTTEQMLVTRKKKGIKAKIKAKISSFFSKLLKPFLTTVQRVRNGLQKIMFWNSFRQRAL
jgi:hypothetical protein